MQIAFRQGCGAVQLIKIESQLNFGLSGTPCSSLKAQLSAAVMFTSTRANMTGPASHRFLTWHFTLQQLV